MTKDYKSVFILLYFQIYPADVFSFPFNARQMPEL